MPKWIRDFLVLPLVVGLIVSGVTFGFSKILADKNELSYEIDSPTNYLNDPAVKRINVSVDGKPVKDIVAYRVRLWNSGDKPIKNIPVRIVFNPHQKDFQIFSLAHNTTPKFEFGEISELSSEKATKRFKYSLLNSEDQDIITILTNGASEIEFFAKAEGLKVKERKQDEGPFSWKWQAIFLFAALAAVLSEMLKELKSLFSLKKEDED